MHSYLYSPSPITGFFSSGLSSARKIIGAPATKAAAPAALINSRRDVELFRLLMILFSRERLLSTCSDARLAARKLYNNPIVCDRSPLDSPAPRRIISPQPRPGGGTGR